MVYLKKYFTEGLIQVAILLSLCGVRVDVGLEPYLPPSLQEMIMGQTSALTQTQFHNLRNRLQDGPGSHSKNVDLEGFFTTRRLLGWVRSLDRLQVPQAELETWLVQREPDALPIERPDQSSLLERAPARAERDLRGLTVEPRPGLVTTQEESEGEEGEDKEEEIRHELHHRGDLDESGDEEEDVAAVHRHYMRTEGGRHAVTRDLEQTCSPLQECLRLLEETFPFTEEQQVLPQPPLLFSAHSDVTSFKLPAFGVRQLGDVGGRGGDPGSHQAIIPTDEPTLDLELDWQDLFALMEPVDTEVDTVTSFDNVLESPAPGRTLGTLSYNSHDSDMTHANQDAMLVETPLQHGFLWPPSRPQLEPALLPLTPSAELDDQSSALNTWDVSNNSTMNTLHTPPDHMELMAEEPSADFYTGQNADANLSSFNMNLLAPSPPLSPERNGMTPDLSVSSPGVFLVDEEDIGDDDLPDDLLEDAAILDEMRLLDLALEDGFSPEMAAQLEEEGYLDHDSDRDHLTTGVTEDPSETRTHQQDDEADTDSGLSLDFSFSPASPCASEASYYSSSSSSASSSSSSSLSDVDSEDKDEDAEEGLFVSEMEVEVTIKQEEPDEEEMGAVGGGYPEDINKLFPVNYGDHKLFNGFPWLEQIDHDHTYNQPLPSASSPSSNKPTKHTKSSPQHPHPRNYHYAPHGHISEAKVRSRDERRARSLKIPFSSELIVNLPVEEFNDMLTEHKLTQEQLNLIRDIRRRGKNKIAAQNCRKRKLDVLLGLEDNVSSLRRRRSQLLREKQEALRNLQEMKRRLGALYQDVFSRLRDEEGRPLDSAEFSLDFGPDGSVTVASHQHDAWAPLTGEKSSKKQRSKKK